jgi:hypothetical protein
MTSKEQLIERLLGIADDFGCDVEGFRPHLEQAIAQAWIEDVEKAETRLHREYKERIERAIENAAQTGKPNMNLVSKTLQNMRPMVLLNRADGEYAMYWDDSEQVWNRARYKDLLAEAKRQLKETQPNE